MKLYFHIRKVNLIYEMVLSYMNYNVRMYKNVKNIIVQTSHIAANFCGIRVLIIQNLVVPNCSPESARSDYSVLLGNSLCF